MFFLPHVNPLFAAALAAGAVFLLGLGVGETVLGAAGAVLAGVLAVATLSGLED
jgi:hypothetical protein